MPQFMACGNEHSVRKYEPIFEQADIENFLESSKNREPSNHVQIYIYTQIYNWNTKLVNENITQGRRRIIRSAYIQALNSRFAGKKEAQLNHSFILATHHDISGGHQNTGA
jgi:hypothetical protein